MRNYDFSAPLGDFDMGTLFLVVNEIPEVGHCTYYKSNLHIAKEAYSNDPFAIVYLHSEQGVWYKGEYCYSNERYKFARVAMAAVPLLILTMNLVKP